MRNAAPPSPTALKKIRKRRYCGSNRPLVPEKEKSSSRVVREEFERESKGGRKDVSESVEIEVRDSEKNKLLLLLKNFLSFNLFFIKK